MTVGKGGAVYVAISTNNWKLKLPGVVDGLAFTSLAVGTRTFASLRSLNGQPSEGFSLAADRMATSSLLGWRTNSTRIFRGMTAGALHQTPR